MDDVKLAASHEEKAALVIDPKDNTAVALTDLSKGDLCIVRKENREESIVVLEDIPFGHKIALQPIGRDESVYKYGEEIGKMKVPVPKGGWIHSHNMYCERGMKHGR
ncbi:MULTISPECIES: UxaA family hydrolase [Paenibacillus]|uniref:SAF domain-containing protein n=1 Tax=Paenibacillus naphthalenovorans TaxID=162209 RepID=A0A0U2VU60_9BACL|nr:MULTISPECIES: UxaA family hydrolase [Paenibacillus]ALS23063.1 SAF domain-containing protein [Paenibacillus naphthalenovorans]SDI41338.1 altronate dehydratase small subunit [Paenibacillus naphthalenovorans]